MESASDTMSSAVIKLIIILGSIAFLVAPILGYEHTGGVTIHSDGISYYSYLPAAFIDRDLSFETFSANFNNSFPSYFGIKRYPATGNYLNKYTIGVAVMMAPFFAIAHTIQLLTGQPTNGLAPVYQGLVGLSGLFYMITGSYILMVNLKEYFSDRIAAIAVFFIVFGTNLFNYGTFNPTMSHAYSFCLITAFIFVTKKWYEQPNLKVSLILGLVAGMIVLVRIPNIIFLGIFPLYGLTQTAHIYERFQLYRKHILLLLLILIIILSILSPQVWYWHAMTGQWFVQSYQEEGFNWLSPNFFGVLFSTQKGLFFWSPILVYAIIGLAMLYRTVPAYVVGFTTVLIMLTYIIASWHEWQYGWSYGHRAFIDGFSIFAFGIATFLSQLRRRALNLALSIGMLCVVMSMIQMLQYWVRILPPRDTTWDLYQQVFLRLW